MIDLFLHTSFSTTLSKNGNRLRANHIQRHYSSLGIQSIFGQSSWPQTNCWCRSGLEFNVLKKNKFNRNVAAGLTNYVSEMNLHEARESWADASNSGRRRMRHAAIFDCLLKTPLALFHL
jgi:hypothetical protein